MLDRLLYSDIQRRTGSELNEKQKERLLRTVRHYMGEVSAKNPGAPVQSLNKEVLTAVIPDYMGYLRRTAGPTLDEAAPGELSLTTDVNTRFSQLQAARQDGKTAPPVAPDFRISMEEEGPASVARFEELKKIRETESATVSAAAAMILKTQIVANEASASRGDASIARLMDADAEYKAGVDAARSRDEELLASRTRARQQFIQNQQQQPQMDLALPDPRKVLFGDNPMLPFGGPRGLGLANSNPTFALPEAIRDRPVLPQDVIKPQDDILSYRENEYNLFVYSADRDWVNNNTENRYNFSVNFDPANNRPGFSYSTATNIKFKNITRIEFVKAIMPTEACDTLTTSTAPVESPPGEPTLSTDLNMNIFSYPYLQVRIPELDTNGYGTNDGLNNAFASISYDAYWTADVQAKNRGYARMIPKFLKCQKIFYPTPLATLQKLTFQIQKPDGSTVCSTQDTLDVSGFIMSDQVDTSSKYYDASGIFLWIQTKTYFNRFAFSQGDRIQFKNTDMPSAFKTAAGAAATSDFLGFVNRTEGHLICDIGRYDGAGFRDGPNVLGYANCIIVRGNFQDPTTGSTGLKLWGGSTATNTTFLTELEDSNGTVSSGRFINLNHQVQIILRVITRDLDSASRLRPDNLQA